MFSARISTQIQNIETYSNFSSFIVKMMQGKWLWLRDFMLKWIINFLPFGPSEKELQKGSTICHAEVTNKNGEKVTATILGPEAYVFSAQTLLVISQKIMDNHVKTGYQTPNMYGIELLHKMPNVKVE